VITCASLLCVAAAALAQREFGDFQRGGRLQVQPNIPYDGQTCLGHVNGIERKSGKRLYRTAVTRIENVDAPLTEDGTDSVPG